jgi:energy-coupling factor transporter ATP-binding protein EcfA2
MEQLWSFTIMDTITPLWRIVLIPRPLTPLAACVYYVLSKSQEKDSFYLGEKHYTRWAMLPVQSPHRLPESWSPHLDADDTFINLNLNDAALNDFLKQRIHKALESVVPWEARKQALHFFSFGKQMKVAWSEWLSFTGKLSRYADAKDALKTCCEMFDRMFAENLNPAQMSIELDAIVAPSPPPVIESSAYRAVTVPVSKRAKNIREDDSADREVINFTTKYLRKCMVSYLLGQTTVILVGGNSGVGKSTFASSLGVELKNDIESIQSEGGIWEPLKDLKVRVVSLDTATPVTDAVMLSQGQQLEHTTARKRPWTDQLVLEAVQAIESAIAEGANIIIADLPGKISNYTRALMAYATFGIFLGSSEKNSWIQARECWEDFFRRSGIPVVELVKSTKRQSMLVELYSGRSFSGRVFELARMVSDRLVYKALE